jgi:2,4-dienoyl-CoA reductase-like NADH-dependent reductase (Old Yellow Enzyme family)
LSKLWCGASGRGSVNVSGKRTSQFPHLFAPGRIGRLAVRNPILMAPMEKTLAAPTGAVTQRHIDYCEASAAGGAGPITLESMYVHPAGKG